MNGHRQELEDTIAAYYPRVRRHFASLIRNSAMVDDLSQEVFARLWSTVQRKSEIADLGPFIRGIMRNVLREHLRERRHSQAGSVELDTVQDPKSDTPGAAVSKAERCDATDGLLRSLDDKERQLVIARYVLELTGQELSDLMSEPRTTLLYRLERAVEKLRRSASTRRLEL